MTDLKKIKYSARQVGEFNSHSPKEQIQYFVSESLAIYNNLLGKTFLESKRVEDYIFHFFLDKNRSVFKIITEYSPIGNITERTLDLDNKLLSQDSRPC